MHTQLMLLTRDSTHDHAVCSPQCPHHSFLQQLDQCDSLHDCSVLIHLAQCDFIL